MNFNPSTIKEAFPDYSYNFTRDLIDSAVETQKYKDKYEYEHKKNETPKHYKEKEWYETDEGMIYMGAGLVALISIVVVLNQLR